MANTIRDAKSAALGAMMDIAKATKEFALEWTMPDIMRAQAAVAQNVLNQWEAYQPEINAAAKQDPQAHAKAVRQINDIRKRFPNTGG